VSERRAGLGAAGVDGETFARIDAQGAEQWLGMLLEELVSGRYVPKPLLRVWIPKSNGGQRPLGIPCIGDRVVQMAAVLIIGAIFEADLLPQQYGFRPGLDAKMALRRVYWHVTQHGVARRSGWWSYCLIQQCCREHADCLIAMFPLHHLIRQLRVTPDP
jgi:retron-type reverse transcriptase